MILGLGFWGGFVSIGLPYVLLDSFFPIAALQFRVSLGADVMVCGLGAVSLKP